jgi:hypothetical protein
MSILTEEEIERLKETHPKKRILRIFFLFFGMILIIGGIALLFLGVDFGWEIDEVNASFIIDILLILFGMIFASKFFMARYYLRENSLTLKKMRNYREPVETNVKLNSVALSRLIAGFLLIVVGVMSMVVFSLGVGHDATRYGNALVLGGPSWFYVTGLPALIIGISLAVLYFPFSLMRGNFSRSKNFYFFKELRPLCPWLTEIPRKDIEAIRYQNNHLGPKYLWIMLLLPFIVMQLQTAIPLFQSERAAPEFILSWTFLITSIVEIVVLFILVGVPQNYYEIATKDLLYEMWFSPVKMRGQGDLRNEIADLFNCGVDEREIESSANTSTFADVSNTHFQLFNFVFGTFLIISGIIMLTNMILFGNLFWWIALMYGLILIFKAISYDFSRKGGNLFHYDKDKKIYKFQRNFGYKFHYVTAYNVESVKVRKWYRRLDMFDIFGLGGMLVMLALQQTEGWAIVSTLGVVNDNIISTIYMVIVFIFIFLYLCIPIDVIEFKTPTITYRNRVTLKLKEKGLFNKYIKNVKSFPNEIKRNSELHGTFMQRSGMIATIVFFTLIYAIYNLISYFYPLDLSNVEVILLNPLVVVYLFVWIAFLFSSYILVLSLLRASIKTAKPSMKNPKNLIILLVPIILLVLVIIFYLMV